MATLLGSLLVLAALFGVLRLALGGGVGRMGGSRTPSRRGGGSTRRSLTGPTGMLRQSGGPFRYSNRSRLELWIDYVLAMTLGTDLVFASASIYAGIARGEPVDQPSTRAIVAMLVLLACVLAFFFSLGGVLNRRSKGSIGNRLLRATDVALAVAVAVVDPWAGSLLQAFTVVGISLFYRGRFRTLVDLGTLGLSYYLLFLHDGVHAVVLSAVMTTLMGTLTMLAVVAATTVSPFVIGTVLFALAGGAALLVPTH